MSSILSKIKRGTANMPLRIVAAGPEGVGKSTLGSKAPSPLFVCAEDGLTGLDYLQRIVPADLSELNELVDSLITSPGDFKTLVVDTADWLERLIGKSICARDGKSDIEDYGYGKGYSVLEGELVNLLQKFDTLRSKSGIGIVILSHVHIRTFNAPTGESYERFEMKGHKRFTGILREWADACLFCTYEVFQTKEKGKQREKTIGGERVMHTTWSPAWDAKNRLNLPEVLPLDWDALETAIKENSPDALRAQIKKLFATAKLDEASKAKWTKYLLTIDGLSADKLKAAIEALNKKQ
jgi:hypothetical protein